jgi:hypothetical protein
VVITKRERKVSGVINKMGLKAESSLETVQKGYRKGM